jgi:hypothetical protein
MSVLNHQGYPGQELAVAENLVAPGEMYYGCPSPFVDGSILVMGKNYSERRYTIANDGNHIDVANAKPGGMLGYEGGVFGNNGGPHDTFVLEAEYMIHDFPETGSIYGLEIENRKIIGVSLPTLPTAHEFYRERFRGLPVAGIRVIQTADLDDTPSREYVRLLHDDFALPASSGISKYLHDTTTHGPGAEAVEESNFAAYLSLYEAKEELLDGFPQYEKQFIDSLAAGFDISTGSVMEQMSRYGGLRPEHNYLFLLAWSLREINHRCGLEIAERACVKLDDFGMGAPIPDPGRNYTNYVVPWEAGNLPAHYEQIAARLG